MPKLWVEKASLYKNPTIYGSYWYAGYHFTFGKVSMDIAPESEHSL